MAETILSPGVLQRENDQSFIAPLPTEVGASIIGPTVKGPVTIPTLVTSYSDYVSRFGDTLTSGSDVFSLFKQKDIAAKTTTELLTNPLVMNTDEELKIQAENANDLHVVCSYLEIT